MDQKEAAKQMEEIMDKAFKDNEAEIKNIKEVLGKALQSFLMIKEGEGLREAAIRAEIASQILVEAISLVSTPVVMISAKDQTSRQAIVNQISEQVAKNVNQFLTEDVALAALNVDDSNTTVQ